VGIKRNGPNGGQPGPGPTKVMFLCLVRVSGSTQSPSVSARWSLPRLPYHRYSTLQPLLPLHLVYPSTKQREQSVVFKVMSSTGQAVSSTSSSGSNVQSILDALAVYSKITGIDLSENRIAATANQADSPENILQLFRERDNAFKEFPDGSQRLTSTLNVLVRVIFTISGVLDEAVDRTVRHIPPAEPFNLTSSDPLSTEKCFICRDRYSPCCTSLEYALSKFPWMNEFVGCQY